MKSKRYRPVLSSPCVLVDGCFVPNDHPLCKATQILALADQGIEQYAEALRNLGSPQDDATSSVREVEQ